MDSGRRHSDALGRSARIVKDKGRVYLSKGKYITLRVFSKARGDVVTLQKVYGGNYYEHGTGYIWVLGDKEGLKYLVESLDTVPPNLEKLRSP